MPPSHRQGSAAILQCRTQVMGGKRYDCPQCKTQQYAYHSCNNRHCPQCGGDKTEGWLKKQFDRLLPVPYFFATFTLPEEFRPLIPIASEDFVIPSSLRRRRRRSRRLPPISALSAGISVSSAFLQTWAANLFYHPHIHYIIPGVGLSKDHKHWIKIKNKKFLVHVKPLGIRFKTLFQTGAGEKISGTLFASSGKSLESETGWFTVNRQATGGK